jgi:flagellar motor switch/type III secretory pathway protein FliN
MTLSISSIKTNLNPPSEVLTRDIPFKPSIESAAPLDVLMNIDPPVTITFGSVEIPLGDVLKLTTGSIVVESRFQELLLEAIST